MSNAQANQEQITHLEPEQNMDTQSPTESTGEDDDFKITVKKIASVVRPRGVLAE